ncbi:hypothetical protein CB1_000412003 [Camelus ferus]|nr:hypothetical protein CB1_000412003 [Camelus ferus]
MDQYSLEDEGTLPSEMHLPSFSESQGLNCSDTLNRDLGPSTRDLLYTGLSGLDLDPSLPTPDVPSEALEDNLDTLSLYSGKDSDSMKLLEEYTDPESQTSVQDLGLGTLKVLKEADEGGRAGSGSTRKGRRQHGSPQNPLLDCSLCGKVFSSASSLSKHYLTHSQERKHVCKICSKAFKRQDHLTGHMLTHQKTKPFVCIEQGCSKSYCDYRSLRRHYEVQHGLCILKEAPPEEEACGDSPHTHEAAGGWPAHTPGGLRTLVPPEARSPGSLLPSRDLLRCIVNSIVHQKLPSPGPAPDIGEGRSTACSCPPSSRSSSCAPAGTLEAPGAPGPEVPEEPQPPRKEPTADVFTAVQSRAAENNGPDPLLQLPSSLEGWPEGGPLPTCLPLFRGQTVPAGSQTSSHNFQWLRNLPGCPKNKGNNMFPVHKPPAVPSREGSEPGPGLSSASPMGESSPSLGTGLEDALPFPPAFLKAPGEASGDPRYASGEHESWASKKSKFDCDSFSRQNPGESGLQDIQKPSGLSSDATPLFRQLFLKSQESLVSHEQMQVFQMITKSQRIFSHAQVAAATSQLPMPDGKQAALKSLQGTWPQQPLPLTPTVDSLHAGPTQLGGDEPPGAQLPGKQAQAENGTASGATKGFRKEKVKMDMCCTASPSQVAMASFSSAGPPADPPQDSKSKLTIFNRIQGGNIYRLPYPMKEENMAGGCNQHSGGPADWAEPRGTYICKNCSQMFYTEKGLSSHMCFHSDQWPSPRGKQEQQVFGTEFCKPPRQVLRPEGEEHSPLGARKSSDNMTATPLVVPVSGPVAPMNRPPGNMAKGQEKDREERDSKESSQHRKRKKRPQPKALFVPPPSSTCGEPGPGGCHQSCLRSPVFLVDRLLKGLFQCSPYTPPPMLSPIREGSGLYFNTLCSTSAQAGPDRLISTMLDQVEGSFGICVVKDDTKISIEPDVRVTVLSGRSPPGHVLTSASPLPPPLPGCLLETVTELCNVACSSVMPGGGTNLELALHCLHEAQGNIQVALETLLLQGPQKLRTHPLADYRYTGSDIWTPVEKRLFKKAFCAHKKDFYLIHKTVRVFDKIKSRNAHMKRHRLQDHVEPIVRVKWPVKPFQLKEEEEEEMGADMGPLQW